MNLNLVPQLFREFPSLIENRGFEQGLKTWLEYARITFLGFPPLVKRRLDLGRELRRRLGTTVAHGPFAGFQISPTAWNVTDGASMLLGLYEQEVLTALMNAPSTHRTFVNLGAADGYYAVGAVASKLFDRSIAFELTERGQRAIKTTAELNGVADRVAIHGRADASFIEAIPAAERSRSVILIDIEGAEFDVLTSEVLAALSGSIFVIEIHDWMIRNGAARFATLRENAGKHYTLSELRTGPRDPCQFPELADFSDDDRWILCSEGRPRAMTWLRMDPR